MHEIANGLFLSEVSFIWAVRLHPDEKITNEEALPHEVIKGNNKGIIVQGRVPQAKTLGHGSIGGVLSQCGGVRQLRGWCLGYQS